MSKTEIKEDKECNIESAKMEGTLCWDKEWS